MVGGPAAASLGEELVFRVEFPERPGALLRFLDALGTEFDISLFHYRNHGAAFGRILVGFKVPQNRRSALRRALASVGYRYWEETDNPAYKTYLGPSAVS
jgi:threonine dehydratase